VTKRAEDSDASCKSLNGMAPRPGLEPGTCGLTDLSPTRLGTTRHTGSQTYTIAHATHRTCRVYGPVFWNA